MLLINFIKLVHLKISFTKIVFNCAGVAGTPPPSASKTKHWEMVFTSHMGTNHFSCLQSLRGQSAFPSPWLRLHLRAIGGKQLLPTGHTRIPVAFVCRPQRRQLVHRRRRRKALTEAGQVMSSINGPQETWITRRCCNP